MEPGNFYGYYKPTYINGYAGVVDQDLNLNFLQAFEGHCREELTLKPQSVSPLKDNLMTVDLANANFKSVFNRTKSDVNFLFNPNMRRFRRIMREDLASDEQNPVLFVYYPELYMKNFVRSFAPVVIEN